MAVFRDVRLGDIVVLQLRSVVESEQLGWRFPAFLQEYPYHIDRHRADVECPINRLAEFANLVLFQEQKNLNPDEPEPYSTSATACHFAKRFTRNSLINSRRPSLGQSDSSRRRNTENDCGRFHFSKGLPKSSEFGFFCNSLR